MRLSWGRLFLACVVVVATTAVSTAPQGPPQMLRQAQAVPGAFLVQAATSTPPSSPAVPSKAFVDTYCVDLSQPAR